jgi:hypothetical protein
MPEREEREIPRGCLVADKWLCWLPLVELVATWLGVCNGGGREREGGRNWEEADFVAYFGPSFLLPQGLKSTSIYKRWKWAILSTLGKNFSS